MIRIEFQPSQNPKLLALPVRIVGLEWLAFWLALIFLNTCAGPRLLVDKAVDMLSHRVEEKGA